MRAGAAIARLQGRRAAPTAGLFAGLLGWAALAGAQGQPATPPAAAPDSPGQQLVQAAQRQDPAAALGLIDHGADVNATSADGTTALMWAAHAGDRALVQRLLKAHADPNAANYFGANALLQAAQFGDARIVTLLLKAGAKPNGGNADGETALMLAARAGNLEVARALLRAGADVNAKEGFRGQSALIWAGGMTPLLYAARQGCLGCVHYLIEKGHADINLADPEGITPLLIATENFHFDVAAYLVKKGADVNRWDWWGRTPLYAAVDLNTLPYGGRPDHISLDDTTALKLIQILLDAGANPNAQLKLFPPYRALGPDRGGDMLLTIGTTPLARAARGGDSDAIRLLLAHHADPNIGNNSDVTPLMLAAGYGTSPTDTRGRYRTEEQALGAIDVLLKGGADVNAANVGGATALHGAASVGYDQVVKVLAAHNARLDAKDARGFTPADYALGKAAFGRGTPTVHQGTAELIRQLQANQAAPATPVARNAN